jgi:GPH family glycoside/pentoside/hexuronide:cation symporter
MALGLGQAAATGTENALFTLASPIYTVMLGVSPIALSLTLFVHRIWNAFCDPVAGQYSDNLRTRWGRRRPFLLFLGVPMALSYGAIWFYPAAATPNAALLHFGLTCLVFVTLSSWYFVPLTALQLEVTNDYHERTRVASVVGICTWALTLCNQWMFPLIQSNHFAEPLHGVRIVAVVAAVYFSLLALAPAFWVPERVNVGVITPAVRKQPLVEAVRQSFANRDFVLITIARSVSNLAQSTVASLGFFLNYLLAHAGDLRSAAPLQGLLGSGYVVACIASYWGFKHLALRFGKRRALQLAAAVYVVAGGVKLLVYLPGERWWQLIVPVLNGIAAAGVTLVTTSMLADIVDVDERDTGRRREGLYAAVISWVDRIGAAVGSLGFGFLLVGIGYETQRGGSQHPATIELMKWIYALLPALGGIAAIVCAARYRLTEAQVCAIKAELERRPVSDAAAEH